MRKYWTILLLIAACGTESPVPIPAVAELDRLPEPVAILVAEGRQRVVAHPNDSQAWGNYGNILQANGFHEASIAAYAQAHDLDSGGPEWPAQIAVVAYSEIMDSLLAANSIAIARQNAPNDPYIAFLAGRIFEDMGRYEDALGAYRVTAKLLPENDRTDFAIGRLLLNSMRYEESKPYLERAIQVHPGSASVRASVEKLARSAPQTSLQVPQRMAKEESGPITLPMPYRENISRNTRQFKVLSQYARQYVLEGLEREALSLLQLLVRLYPEQTRAEHWIDLAHTQTILGQHSAAMDSYENCLRRFPEAAEAYLGLADLSFMQGAVDESAKNYQHALDHAESALEKARALQGKGRVSATRRDFLAALKFLQEAELALPQMAVVQMDLARVLADMKRYEEAWIRVERAEALGFPVSSAFKNQLRVASIR